MTPSDRILPAREAPWKSPDRTSRASGSGGLAPRIPERMPLAFWEWMVRGSEEARTRD